MTTTTFKRWRAEEGRTMRPDLEHLTGIGARYGWELLPGSSEPEFWHPSGYSIDFWHLNKASLFAQRHRDQPIGAVLVDSTSDLDAVIEWMRVYGNP